MTRTSNRGLRASLLAVLIVFAALFGAASALRAAGAPLAVDVTVSTHQTTAARTIASTRFSTYTMFARPLPFSIQQKRPSRAKATGPFV